MRELRRHSLEPEGAGADRVLHDPVAIALDDLARDHAGASRRLVVGEARVRLGERSGIV